MGAEEAWNAQHVCNNTTQASTDVELGMCRVAFVLSEQPVLCILAPTMYSSAPFTVMTQLTFLQDQGQSMPVQAVTSMQGWQCVGQHRRQALLTDR